jgi:voltage-gated potassium channel
MVTCIDSDAENIFATLTARELRPDIHIVARAAEEASERKLRAAGAHDVISPYKTSGSAMARLALNTDLETAAVSDNGPARDAVVSGEMPSSAESTPSQ